MSPSFAINDADGSSGSRVAPPSVTGRFASVYSEVQNSRIVHTLPLPSVLKSPFKIVDGPQSSAAGSPDEIAKLFPNLFGQPSAILVPSGSDTMQPNQKLKIGVVLSGGQAPGGHNVISGIFDYLQDSAKGSTLYGFRGGPAGIMKCKYVELTSDYIYPYRNQGGFDMIHSGRDKIETPEQFKQAEETVQKLDLDGLVVIGEDDSNINACLLAEYFRSKNMKTHVIGCPKTIDGPFGVIDEDFNSILPSCYDAIGLVLKIRIIHQHQVTENLMATGEELQFDVVRDALEDAEHQYVRVFEYRRLVVEHQHSQERISILEADVKMLKDQLGSTTEPHDASPLIPSPHTDIADEVGDEGALGIERGNADADALVSTPKERQGEDGEGGVGNDDHEDGEGGDGDGDQEGNEDGGDGDDDQEGNEDGEYGDKSNIMTRVKENPRRRVQSVSTKSPFMHTYMTRKKRTAMQRAT